MTPQDEFNLITEARLAKMAAENLEKRFEEWTKHHDRNADERHADMRRAFDVVSDELRQFCRNCTGPIHSQQIFRLTVWVGILTMATIGAYFILGFDLTKLLPK